MNLLTLLMSTVKRYHRILLAAYTTAQAAWIVVTAYILVAPHHVLKGPLEGQVALLWYSLIFFETSVRVAQLDAVTVYAYTVVVGVALALEALVLALKLLIARRLSKTMRAFMASSALVSLPASGVIAALSRLEADIVSRIARIHGYTTSAGRIILEEQVIETTFTHSLAGMVWLLAAATSILAVLVYLGAEEA